ncbi:hypothetical protein Pint_36677 [Pistacia integerrima]|uniref:Uncharacterized protein n=1 Tax=Pistacia integerrima TaxID=434235 RepID=A0ACC0Y2U4_9ROSI|nr:hypothetical protein Pint_36677 [Pistacia integerrima]
MESSRDCIRLLVLVATTFFTLTDGRVARGSHFRGSKIRTSPIYNRMKFDFEKPESYGLNSPFSMPPFESLTPLPSPNNSPAPFGVCPPFLPQPPFQSPPYSPPPNPISPSSPLGPESPLAQNPIPPSPPQGPQIPSPPLNPISPSQSPPQFVPLPPIYQPPVVLPPPSVPPPPQKKPQYAVWCVAKPTVPDSIIQEAMDYACGSGADCKSIQQNGPCFQPNTMFSHASYAFNSYWQKSKQAGGTCDFGFDECQFISN